MGLRPDLNCSDYQWLVSPGFRDVRCIPCGIHKKRVPSVTLRQRLESAHKNRFGHTVSLCPDLLACTQRMV